MVNKSSGRGWYPIPFAFLTERMALQPHHPQRFPGWQVVPVVVLAAFLAFRRFVVVVALGTLGRYVPASPVIA